MPLNYQPTVRERIGGPWSLTLRAYLWTAPLGVLLQPVVEPGFWNGDSDPVSWMALSLLGYLAFGFVIFVGNKIILPNRRIKPAPASAVIAIAMLGGMARSMTIGTNLELFGLTGINGIQRLPFGAFLGFVWVVNAALVVDFKYRYKTQLHELVTEQQELLARQTQRLKKFNQALPVDDAAQLEVAQRSLQNVIRDITVRASVAGTEWAKVSTLVYRAAMKVIHVGQRDTWVSQKPESELRGSRSEVLKVITRTPMFNIPIVMAFTAISLFFGGARLYPIESLLIWMTFGLALNFVVLVIAKEIIVRSEAQSSLAYINMLATILIIALVVPSFFQNDIYSTGSLRVFALAATSFEFIWIFSTGYVQFMQQNRQNIINAASNENKLLRIEQDYWLEIEAKMSERNYSSIAALELVTSDLSKMIEANKPDQVRGPIQFANSLMSEINIRLTTINDFSLESELERIERTWNPSANVIWTVSGSAAPIELTRRAVGVLEVCVSKSVRHGNASVISVDVNRTPESIEITVTDNGHVHDDNDTGLGIELLNELSKNTWVRIRTGGLTKMTATIN